MKLYWNSVVERDACSSKILQPKSVVIGNSVYLVQSGLPQYYSEHLELRNLVVWKTSPPPELEAHHFLLLDLSSPLRASSVVAYAKASFLLTTLVCPVWLDYLMNQSPSPLPTLRPPPPPNQLAWLCLFHLNSQGKLPNSCLGV